MDRTGRENCKFDGVLKDKWVSAETATGVRDCGYGRTVWGTDTGMLQV